MNKKTIKEVDVFGKKCLVRVDFNVPIKDGVISDLNRINGAIPTIKYLVDHGAKVVLCSHMGRPKGEFNKKYTLKPVAEKLQEMMGQTIVFANDVIGEDAKTKVAALKNGEVVLLENLRFHKEEELNDKDFAKALSQFCDIYVNDAFGTAHRAHASTAGIALYGFSKESVAGFLIGRELEIMGGALDNPARPFVAVLGGAKVADKLKVISNLLEKVDSLIIGGGMAYTFIKAAGGNIGQSLVDNEKLDYCQEMLVKATQLGKKIYLPVDSAVADSFPDPIDAPIAIVNCNVKDIPTDKTGLDIGVESQKLFADVIKSAKTVIWNGPMGVFENPTLAKGTIAVAKAMADADAITIIGGGDSAAAVAQLGFADKMTHISTGGGASLEFLEGLVLPGVDCLDNK